VTKFTFVKIHKKLHDKVLQTTCLYNHMQSFAVKMTHKTPTLLIYYCTTDKNKSVMVFGA
jgi:hypothetical protein